MSLLHVTGILIFCRRANENPLSVELKLTDFYLFSDVKQCLDTCNWNIAFLQTGQPFNLTIKINLTIKSTELRARLKHVPSCCFFRFGVLVPTARERVPLPLNYFVSSDSSR